MGIELPGHDLPRFHCLSRCHGGVRYGPAAGAQSAVAAVKTLREGKVPPTINYTPDPEIDIPIVGNVAAVESMSESRGDGWALRSKSSRATGYTRPIRIVCYPDRLLIVPAPGTGQAQQAVLMSGSTRGARRTL